MSGINLSQFFLCVEVHKPLIHANFIKHFLEGCHVKVTTKYVQALYKDTMAALQDLLKSALAKDPTPDGLQSVFKVKCGVRVLNPSHLSAKHIISTSYMCIIALVCFLIVHLKKLSS